MSLFATRTLRQHALHHVFQATVITKLSYASPAWWGFANADDKARLEAFLDRSVRFGYCEASSPTIESICGEADEELFNKVARSPRHLLHDILSPARDSHYELIVRRHNLALPIRSTILMDCNFAARMLYKNMNYSNFHSRRRATMRL
jgi:hypothetical protein